MVLKKNIMNSSIVGLLSKLISQPRETEAIKYILDCAKHSISIRFPFPTLPPVHKEVVKLLMQVKIEFGLKSLFQMIVK